LLGNEALIGMRAHTLTYSPLKELPEAHRLWVKILNFILPVCIIAAILLCFYFRRLKREKNIKKEYIDE
ncbi:MAG: hypothetical protein PHE19_08500, partial [Candidatus Cloacimonetes bacterium]|nr:hypothetical protein [Candidatus Cloacimonadota bacterium]